MHKLDWQTDGNVEMQNVSSNFVPKNCLVDPLSSSVAAIEFYHNPQILPPMWILAKCHIGSRHISTYFDISDDRLIT